MKKNNSFSFTLQIDKVERLEQPWFKEHLATIERVIDEKYNSIQKESEEATKTLSDDRLMDANEHYDDLLFEVSVFEQMLLRSFVVSIWISIEDLFTLVCRIAKTSKSQVFSSSEIKGQNGVKQAQYYLKRVVGVPMPQDDNLREKLEIARVVRNAVVHANGKINGERELRKIEKYLKEHPNELEIEKILKRINVKRNYAHSLIKLHLDLFRDIKEYPLDI